MVHQQDRGEIPKIHCEKKWVRTRRGIDGDSGVVNRAEGKWADWPKGQVGTDHGRQESCRGAGRISGESYLVCCMDCRVQEPLQISYG